MSDAPTGSPATPEQPPEGPQQAHEESQGTEAANDVASLPDWAQGLIRQTRQEAASYRTQVRELEPFRAKVQEAEDAAKSDLQKATERAEAAERQLAAAQAEALRAQVAAAKGLTPDQARRLVGSTEEELSADADSLLSAFGGGASQSSPFGRPREDLRGGADPSTTPEELDPAKLAAKVRRPGSF